MKKINVREAIKKSLAVSTDDGKVLYKLIDEALQNKEKVELSFEGIDVLISHFLNEAIGSLYNKYKNWDILDQAIVIIEMDPDDVILFNERVLPTAKIHFENSKERTYVLSEDLK